MSYVNWCEFAIQGSVLLLDKYKRKSLHWKAWKVTDLVSHLAQKGMGKLWNELCLEFLSYYGGWWLIYCWFVTALSTSQHQGKGQEIKIKRVFHIANAFSYLHPHARKPWSSKHCKNTNQLMTPWAKPQQWLFLIHLLFVCAHKRQFCAISLFSQAQNGEKRMWAEEEAKEMECLDWAPHVPVN